MKKNSQKKAIKKNKEIALNSIYVKFKKDGQYRFKN